MPADLIKVGEAFDLTVDAEIDDVAWGTASQTVVLAHGADLVMFASMMGHYSRVAVAPDLSTLGIAVADGGGTCDDPQDPNRFCSYRRHAAVVTTAGESAAVNRAQTARIGWLSFTNGELTGEEMGYWGNCDSPSTTLMAGFRVQS